MDSLKIHSGQGDYSVDFFSGIGTVAGELLKVSKPLLILDKKVENLYSKDFSKLKEKIPFYVVEATEEEKTLEGVKKLCLWMQSQNATKQSTLIVIGGGITQDISCFSAHTYYRGIPWIFIPTTLLAMSDSCIGAKCGINLGKYKNQLGFFSSPSRVIVCDEFVKTLMDEDVSSGYGEILKLYITGASSHLGSLMETIRTEGLRNSRLSQFIRQSLEVKKKVIEQDEYERDLRRTLNYGHSFGHALETITNHEVCHGLAVAWGMDLINFLSWKRGLLPKTEFEKIHHFIKEALPFRFTKEVVLSELINAAKRDKKVSGSEINLVFNTGEGGLRVIKTPFDAALEEQVREYLSQYNVYGYA